MKKFLFYSVAIAAAMASCTQEVIEAPVNDVQDLSVRPTLGEVVLTENADMTSRFAITGLYKASFTEGDKLGAAIIDAPLYPATPYNENNVKGNYTLVNYYSSNSAFTYDGSAWYLNADQPLVEGNYFFYAPYNETMQLRTPFEIRVPQRQDISEEKSALDEYYASGAVVKVGHKFLACENGKAQKPSVKMYEVMSYPMFTIVNNFDGYTVQKAAKLDENGKAVTDDEGNTIMEDVLVEYTGAMKVDSIQLINGSNEAMVIGGLFENETLVNKIKDYGAWYNSPLNTYTADLLNEKATIKTESIITTLVAGGREIAKGETATFYAVMPATQFAEGTLQANVYVTIGEKPYVIASTNVNRAEVTDEDGNVTGYNPELTDEVKAGHTYASTSGTITLIQGQRYPQEEMNYEGGQLSAKKIAGRALKLVLAGGKVSEEEPVLTALQVAKEVSLDETEEDENVSTDLIDNNEEFIQFFKEMESASKLTENNKAEIDYDNAKFAFSSTTTATINSELIEALSTHTYDGSITINTALTISNDVEIIGISGNTVTFRSKNYVTYPITLGSGYTVENTDASKYVASGNKSLHVVGKYTAANNITYGNIKIGYVNYYTYGDMTVKAKVAATTLLNKGILNAEAGTNIINAFENNGTINVKDADAIMTVGSGNGTINIESTVPTTTNATVKYVVVNSGATQVGNYIVETVDATYGLVKDVENAEKILWVNEFTYNNVVDFAANAIASKKVDIHTLHIAGATFNDVATFDMKGLKLDFGYNDVTITGTSLSQTTVKNVTINTYNRVELQDIAFVEECNLTGWGELYADGVCATWKGEAYGVIALEKDDIAKVYTVNTPNGLRELATIVNNGNTLEGYTVKLAGDMDLHNRAWTPIGKMTTASSVDGAYWFKGEFDGCGYTIYNLKSTGTECVALFGAVTDATIKNLNIDGADVRGNHYTAALVAYTYNEVTIKNCNVTNAVVNCTSNANGGVDKDGDLNWDGDKAGTIVGHIERANTLVEGCKASNSTVTAGRDAGQLVGSGYETSVVNCSAENVKVSANGTSDSSNINDELIGRKF